MARFAALVAITLASGCGPSLYLMDVNQAEAQLQQADEGNAQSFAPYEYYFAASYLDKAREEAAEGHYEDAIRFARSATAFALHAERRAQNVPRTEVR